MVLETERCRDDDDLPVAAQHQRVLTTKQTARKTHQTVEVARIIPQEPVKPAGEKTSVRERVRQFEMSGGVSSTSTVEVPRTVPGDRQSADAEVEASNKRRKQESDPDPHAPVHLSLCDGSSDHGTKSVDDSAELETRPGGECEGVGWGGGEEGVPSTKSLGTQGMEGGKGQGESDLSGAASEASSSADGRPGSLVRDRRGVRPATGG